MWGSRSMVTGTGAALHYGMAILWHILFFSIFVRGDKDAFTYFDDNTDMGRGVNDWDSVDKGHYYFPWRSHLRIDNDNDCGSSTRQSPINIDGWKGCGFADNDDDHRHWTVHGDCTLHDVQFTIENWGLLMTYPFIPGQNPEMTPCMHPMMDSSGGYGDAFFANYVSVVSPSEHQIKGESFDAEINIAHFNYGTKLSMIFSVLCRAKDEYVDNPTIESYLREWERVHANNRQKCESHMKHCPVTAKILETGSLDSGIAGSSRDSAGMMFDMKARSNDVAIKAFDVNVANSGTHKHVFRVFVRHGTHVGYETRSNVWKEISRVHVYGNGRDEQTRLMLDIPYLLKKDVLYGFYVFQDNDNDLLNARITGRSTGSEHRSNSDLIIYMGTALGKATGTYNPFTGPINSDRAFAGNVYYARCDLPSSGSSSSYTMSAHHPNGKMAGLELSSSIGAVSGNGFNYIGCFESGGDRDLNFEKNVSNNEDCADACRGKGSKFFVIRQGGKCYCTSGEYSYAGHADECNCGRPRKIGGSNKQCTFRVLARYLGCFRQTNRQDTFERRMTLSRGLSLSKCEEVCFDAGYRYCGRMWDGICQCGNSEQYDKYGSRTGCNCSGENVGAWRLCAYDLGTDVPAPVNIKNNPKYSADRYSYLGCYQDAGNRALPIYIGVGLSTDECAQKCFDANHRYFGIQYKGECYCGDGDYKRHGTSNKCSCNSSNRGVWVLCVYGFTESRRRDLQQLGDDEARILSYFGGNSNSITEGVNSLWSATSILGGSGNYNTSSSTTLMNIANIESDGRLRITAKRKAKERQAAEDFQMSFTNATQLPPFTMVPSTDANATTIICNDTNVKFTTPGSTSNNDVVYKKGVMFDLFASGPHQDGEAIGEGHSASFYASSKSNNTNLINTVAIKGFDLYLSTNFLDNGGMMRNIRVFTRPKSHDGLGSWTDLGLYHVISLGPNIPSSLDLHEPYHIQWGDIQTFVIRDAEPNNNNNNRDHPAQQEIIANAVVHGKTFGDVHHEDSYLTLKINPETKPQMNATFHMTSLSFQGTIHYSLCQKEKKDTLDDIYEAYQKHQSKRRRLDGGPRDADWGPFDWANYPEHDVYRLLTSPWFWRYRGGYTKPPCYNDVRWRVFKEPMQISTRQKTMIDEMIKEMIDPQTCKKSTVGKPRFDGTDYVNVNRPIQRKRSSHDLFICDSDYWKSQGFYNTMRGNTNWKLYDDHQLWVPESHFAP